MLLVFVMLCCHHGNANLVKVEVAEAVLSSTHATYFPASECINNATTGKVPVRGSLNKSHCHLNEIELQVRLTSILLSGTNGDLCHSEKELKPWFKAILRSPVVVDRVVIVNRMVAMQASHRLNGAEVGLLLA